MGSVLLGCMSKSLIFFGRLKATMVGWGWLASICRKCEGLRGVSLQSFIGW